MNLAKKNALILSLFFWGIISTLLMIFAGEIQHMHVVEYGDAFWFASDPGVYYDIYLMRIQGEMTPLAYIYSAMVGVPVLLLLITGGQIVPILLLASSVFFYALYSCMKHLETKQISFFFLILFIPYVLLGFFALNKEIYVVSSTLFFLAYYKSLNKKYLLFCCVALFFSRYYMLFVFVFCLFVFPPQSKKIRWWAIWGTLLFLSILAPLILTGGVLLSYSGDTAVGDKGGVSLLFSELIRNFMYFLSYFPKYIALILSRIWTVIVSGIHSGAKANLLGILFTIYTIALFVITFAKVHYPSRYNYRFLMMVLFSPVPLMFSDIFHWRYYLFTIPMLVFYLNQRTVDDRF